MKTLTLGTFLLNFLHCLPVFGNEVVKYKFKEIELNNGAFPKFALTLKIPASNDYYPGLVAVDDVTIGNMGASVEVVEKRADSVTLLVRIDCGKCEHLMEGDFSWKLAEVSGPEVSLAKDQKFIPLIYFRHCMIGVGVGSDVAKDRHIQNWLSEAAVAKQRTGIISGRKEAEQGSAGQPATRSQSESEGGAKPQPEAEGRSR